MDFDLYPYLTGSTQLVHLLPPQFQEGGTEAICARLADQSCRREITKVLKQPSDIFENIVELAGFDMIYASTLHTEKFRSYAGQSIAKIAEQLEQDPYDTLYDILLAERCQVTMLDTIASEEDMLYFLGINRGILEKGMPADINIFQLDKLKVHADFENPDQYCTGFDYVLVGGEIAVKQDEYRNPRSGRIVRRCNK